MMILLQNHIIYMPNLPPNSRQETISDYPPVCWSEETLRSADGKKIKLLKGIDATQPPTEKQCVIVYFQGNASSLPPRLQFLSQALRNIVQEGSRQSQGPALTYSIAALSYRGYWTSSGRRPTERGIKLDAQAALEYVYQNYDMNNTTIVLWGQSIGAGVATTALATMLQKDFQGNVHVILETPFTHLRDMLVAIYPQKWTPYRYLWPFLRSHWDSEEAFKVIGKSQNKQQRPRILILQSEKDEIVPPEVTDKLEAVGREVGLDIRREVVPGALHQDAMFKISGRRLVTAFVLDIFYGKQANG